MIRYLLSLLLAGCSGATTKHETVSLMCVGLCNYTDVNHERASPPADGSQQPKPPKE